MPNYFITELAYIRYNWSEVYEIFAPRWFDDAWTAEAKFGSHDVLEAWTADGLLNLIRRHYGPKTEGYSEAKKLGR